MRVLLGTLLALLLAAPATAAEVEHVKVPSHDGVELDGWIVKPDGAGDKRLPTVLWSAPYFGQCNYYPFPAAPPYPKCTYATGDDPELYDNSSVSESVPVQLLLDNGYAVAIFSVRGTGASGGCFTWFGADEQRDQAGLVNWIAEQTWSNGKVGMMGLSYHGTTPWEAAIQNPPALKTIVVAGMISDPYLFSHTPQGATFSTIAAFDSNFLVRVSLTPPTNSPEPQHYTVGWLPVAPERLCQDVADLFRADALGTYADDRDAEFWTERRLIDRFPEIRASVLLTHGFQDLWLSGHQMQERDVWATLVKAPKRVLEGQWAHEFPNFNSFRPEFAMSDWNSRLIAWLDFWLKDQGSEPPREGFVDYQDSSGRWHESEAWPPFEARQEVMYLSGDELRPTPGEDTGSFLSVPAWEAAAAPEHLTCAGEGLRFLTEPVASDLLVAGNPFAYLSLTSDQPGGIVAVHLFDVGPDFACEDGFATGVRKLAVGAADLRFHRGNYTAEAFPTGERTPVRVDITNLAEVIPAGHRLAATVSYGDLVDRSGRQYAPELTVHADGGPEASHVVVPLVQGSLGGGAPTLSYPKRPFLPDVPAPKRRPKPKPADDGGGGGGHGPGQGEVSRRPECIDRALPHSRLSARDSRITRRRVVLAGRAEDAGCGGGVVRVDVALAKRARDGRCRFLQGDKLGKRRRCSRVRWIRARGTRRWRLERKASLPGGTYRVWTRAVDARAQRELPVVFGEPLRAR